MQRYFSYQKKGNKFTLLNTDWHHIKNVMRLADGMQIEVVYQNELYICQIKNNSAEIIAKTDSTLHDLNIVLITPVLKEQKMDYILQKATELGVSEIWPVQMERCNVNYDHKKKVKQIRWQKICKEASEQSKRLDVPKVKEIINLKKLVMTNGVKILCSTQEKEKSIKNFLKSNAKYDKLYIVFGPEGGFTLEEEKYLKQKGFVTVTLGDRVLRAETVPLFVLSLINYENME